MYEKGGEDMKRNIAVLFIAGLLLVMSGSAVYAYFSAVSTSSNNVFASGRMDLQLSKDNATYSATVTAAFGGTGLMPGTCAAPGSLYIKNTGGIAANHIDVKATNSNPSLASYLRLDTFTYDGAGVQMNDANANGYADLADLQTAGANNLALTNINQAHQIVMKICLDSSAGNQQQEQSDTVDVSVTLDQGPHSL